MIISIPSVIILSALFISLWGGSIRFTTPMLFALGFLPMFGIGGLTGLPLGLAPTDMHLHDTYYVIGLSSICRNLLLVPQNYRQEDE